MSTSFSADLASMVRPVMAFAYPEIRPRADTRDASAETDQATERSAGPSPEEINALVRHACAETEAQVERRIRQEYEERALRQSAQIRQALEAFTRERTDYFARVEGRVVQLALAIAAKILHREAQVDPTLLAALVRIAMENMNAGSGVSVRVRAEEAAHWRACLAGGATGAKIAVIEDAALDPGACIVETEMGSADFSLDAQLKEVESGFLDLLAERPA